MCTMTWFVKDDGYELFFNRDERLSRQQAKLPTIQQSAGVSYISPTDADAGGTWIAVNQHGVSVCLLNHYQFEQIKTYKDWTSRGEIVRSFAPIVDLVSAKERFEQLQLSDYRAFRMFILDRQGQNLLCVWDGHSARVEKNVTTPKSSSSVDAKHVKQARRELFTGLDLVNSRVSQDYLNYHSSHLPERSKESVCMHRDDAKTVSFSYITVDDEQVSFMYADGSPCEANLGEPIYLNLVEAMKGSATHIDGAGQAVKLAAVK